MSTPESRGRRILTRGPLSARSDPPWLNQATVKGTILVLVGLSLTTATRDSDQLVNEIVGVLLTGWALSELWFRVIRRTGTRSLAAVAFPLTLLAGGLVLIVDPGPGIPVLLGLTLLARGAVVLYRITRPGDSPPAALLRGIALVIIGAAMIAVPEAFLLSTRALIGGAAMILGGILLAAGIGPKDEREVLELDLDSVGELVGNWLRDQRLGGKRTEEISESLFFEPPNRGAKLASFWVMMILATAIATFAIIQDSTAVVIGAMLVAPLMTPIMGVAAGMVNGWAGRMTASLVLVVAAVGAAILLSWVVAAWLPSVGDLTANTQITSRTSPNLLDLCIAVAAGAAGAYAIVDSRVSSSLSGVAIAVALVPPLAVVGITLEAGMADEALGAFLLFLTNFVSIILAGSIVLLLTGYARFPMTASDREVQWRILGPVIVGAVMIAIPLSLTSIDAWTDASDNATAEETVDEWLGDEVDLVVAELDVDDDQVEVVLTGSDDVPPVADLQRALDEGLGTDVDLRLRLVPSTQLTP